MITQILNRKRFNVFSDKRFSEILTGSAWALLANIIATGLGLIFSIIIARVYGAESLGILALIRSFLQLITMATVLGTSTSILRLIPEHLANYSPTSAFKIYRKTLYIVITASIIIGVFFFFAGNFVANEIFLKPHLSFYFSLAAIFIIFRSLVELSTKALRGLGLIKIFAIMHTLPQSASLILLLIISLLWRDAGVPVYALLAGFAFAGISGLITIEYKFKRKMRAEELVRPVPALKIFTISLPMLMTSTMTFIIAQTGIILLGIFRSEAEVGYYAIAVRLATLTALMLRAINTIAGPKFSELYHSGKMNELFYIAKKSAQLAFWTTVPILAVLIIFGNGILTLVFGSKFGLAYIPMVLLVIGQFINSISGATGMFMNMTGNQNTYSMIMIIASIINIGLNFFLIPVLGIKGAALAAMTTLTFWNISTLIYIKNKFGETTGYFPTFKKLRSTLL